MSVTLYEPALRTLLDSPFGPVAADTIRRASNVRDYAQQNAQAEFRTRTGNLVQSIDIFPDEDALGFHVEVGTDGAPYGLLLELGTAEHEIRAINSPFLVSEAGHPDPLLNYHRAVNHPGFPPRPWLMPALRQGFDI